MPRIPRGDLSGEVLHIINRGNARMAVFHDQEDYFKFLALLKEAKRRADVEVFAYCLMPNHFHLALRAKAGGSTSTMMQWLMTSYVRYHHHKYQSSGHLWQGRYKNFMVQQEGYLHMLLRYIEANPVRAGLAGRADAWQFGSAHERVQADRNILDAPPIALPADWIEAVNHRFDQSMIDQIRTSVNRQSPLGEVSWCRQIAVRFGLESKINPVGRPKNKAKSPSDQ